LRLNLYRADGGLRLGKNEVLLEFLDARTDAPVNVGTVTFALDMNMPGMVMHSGGALRPAEGIGRYQAEIEPAMAGDWIAKLTFAGPRGEGSIGLTLTVAP
jgi:hypothetical protein